MLHFNPDTNKMSMIVKDTGTFTVDIENYVLDEGDEVVFTINTGRELENPIIQKRITTFNNGKAIVSLTTQDTNVEPGDYLYDIQFNSADGRVDTIVGPARFVFEGGITY